MTTSFGKYQSCTVKLSLIDLNFQKSTHSFWCRSKLSKYAYDKKQVTIYSPNTILINAIGDVGRVSILNKEASSNQQITGIKPLPDKLNIEYCYYYLLANRHLFYKDLFKTTLPIVNQKKIKLLPIVVPSIEEQVFIVSFLNTLENIDTISDLDKDRWGNEYYEIANKLFGLKENSISISTELTHQLDLVKQLRQAFLREPMQGKLTSEWRASHPELVEGSHSATELLAKIKAEKEQLIKDKKIRKQKPLPPITKEEIPFEIPENWVWCRLGDVCDTITKGSSPKWQGVKYVNSIDEGILFITSKNVDSYKIDLSNSTFVEEKFNEIEPRSILQKGDILTNIVGASIGRTAIYDLDYNANINQAVCILRYEHNYLLKDYLLKLMNSDFIIQLMLEMQFSPGRANLSMSNLSKFPIGLPLLSEQKAIVAKLDELMAYCDGLEESIKNSQTQNEMLLGQVLREALEPNKN